MEIFEKALALFVPLSPSGSAVRDPVMWIAFGIVLVAIILIKLDRRRLGPR